MSIKGIFTVIALLILVCANTLSQTGDEARPLILVSIEHHDGQSGKIEIVQPAQLENLLKSQIANNRVQNGIPGYRVRIFSGSGQTARQRADDTRRNFMSSFPDIEVHLEYNAPNFQVFAGDFRTKNEAIRELKRIERRFQGPFIVSTIIQLPR